MHIPAAAPATSSTLTNPITTPPVTTNVTTLTPPLPCCPTPTPILSSQTKQIFFPAANQKVESDYFPGLDSENMLKPPGRIGHNSNPHSCYIAAILNILVDNPLSILFDSKNTKPVLAEDVRHALGFLIRALENMENTKDNGTLEIRLNKVLSLFSKKENSQFAPYIETLNQLKQILSEPVNDNLRNKKLKIATILRNELKLDIIYDIQQAIFPCIEKIEDGKTVTIENIKNIQDILRIYNFIEQDNRTNEDPKSILQNLLDYFDTSNSSQNLKIEETETTTYKINGISPIQTGIKGSTIDKSETILDQQGKSTHRKSSFPFIQIDTPSSHSVKLEESIADYFSRDERDSEPIKAYVPNNSGSYNYFENVKKMKTERSFHSAAPLPFLHIQVAGRDHSKPGGHY